MEKFQENQRNQTLFVMLTANEISKHLGKLKYGKPHTFTYLVENQLGTPITIDKIIVGCGSCTTAKTFKTNLAPGESTLIEAVYTPGSTGSQKKHINVKYGESMLRLEFTADVEP